MKIFRKKLKIQLTAVFIGALALFTACNTWLDDVVPQGKVLAETYMNDETTAEMAVTGLYNLLTLVSGSGPDGNWLNNHFECYFGSMISDDADKAVARKIILIYNALLPSSGILLSNLYVHSTYMDSGEYHAQIIFWGIWKLHHSMKI